MGLGEDHKLITKSIKNWHKILKKKKEVLADFNSSCTATREFLESKGLKHGSQLDEAGRKELQEHLQKLLKERVLTWS